MIWKTKKTRTKVMLGLQRVMLNCCLGGRLLVKILLVQLHTT